MVLTQVQVVDVRQRGQFGVDLDSCAHISDRVQQLKKIMESVSGVALQVLQCERASCHRVL
jgi:hypothetical protein